MAFVEESLSVILEQFGEENTKRVLSEFICSENEEVETFIKEKAILHENRGLAKTVLVIDTKAKGIVGYYTISTKSFVIHSNISSRMKKKYFGTSQTSVDIIPSILIGQLGKNEAVESSFTGSDLMDLIFRYIKNMSVLTPSLVCYVEHDGREKLRNYYEKHGFTYFKREEDEEKGLYCHMIKTKDVLQSTE